MGTSNREGINIRIVRWMWENLMNCKGAQSQQTGNDAEACVKNEGLDHPSYFSDFVVMLF